MQSSAKFRGLTWKELELSAPCSLASELDVCLTSHNLGGWVAEQEEPSLIWVCYVPCEGDWEARISRIAWDITSLGAKVKMRGSIEDEDWADCWKKFYHPRKFGKNIVVCPSWEKYEPSPDEKVMILDPGMAFGTGYHASTSMCLALVEEALSSGPAEKVLDVGTGSGILSIAAWLMGCRDITASDNDVVAVKAAAENIKANGAESSCRVFEYSGVPEGEYDLVMANLIARLLCQYAQDLANAMKTGGKLIAGGIVDERYPDVLEAFQKAGLVEEKVMRSDDWVSALLVKK